MVWGNVVNALIGIWFILAPFVLRFTDRPGPMWLSVIAGAVLLVLAGWAVFDAKARHYTWIQYVNGLLGIWFVIFSYVFSTLAGVAHVRWTTVVGGLIALGLSAWLAFSVLPKEAKARA